MMTEVRERRWLPVSQWVRENPGFGRLNFVYECCRNGTLLSVRAGRKVLIASDALDALARREPESQ